MWQEIAVYIILSLTLFIVIKRLVKKFHKTPSDCNDCSLKCDDCAIYKIKKEKDKKGK